MATRGHNFFKSTLISGYHSMAAVVGAGAAAPTLPLATVAGAGGQQAGDNRVNRTTPATRSGVGTYVINLDEAPARIIDVIPNMTSPTGTKAVITAWDEAAKTISIQCYTVAGVAAEMVLTNDILRLHIIGKNTRA